MDLRPHAPLWSEIQQRPVGQGGLCHGCIGSEASTLHWIYDCGSNQRDALSAEVARLPTVIDMLFVSHLDDDHVSGLDLLLPGRTVGQIVLPYLTDEARILVAADALGRRRLSGALLDVIQDPVGWFRSRGVEKIVFVGWPNEDNEGEASPIFLPDPLPPSEGPLRPKWARAPQATPKFSGALKVPAGTPLLISSGSASAGTAIVDYILLPHVFKPRAKLLAAFKAELTKRFRGCTALQIVQSLRTASGRDELRACYDELWSDHNLVSMSLYAGPTGRGQLWRTFDNWVSDDELPAGWISTGDASFKARTRRQAFERTYTSLKDQVGVLVTPHHGAESSWDVGLLKAMPNLSVALAAAGPNGYGHPHQAVKDDILRAGCTFRQVSEHPGTGYKLVGWTS